MTKARKIYDAGTSTSSASEYPFLVPFLAAPCLLVFTNKFTGRFRFCFPAKFASTFFGFFSSLSSAVASYKVRGAPYVENSFPISRPPVPTQRSGFKRGPTKATNLIRYAYAVLLACSC